MKVYIEPTLAKLEKVIGKEFPLGKTLLHYTGNMFGIGCRISDRESIQRIQDLKIRHEKSGFIALITDVKWFSDNNIKVPERLQPVLEQYWPGNLTIILECKDNRFEHIARDGKVAFRVPTDPMLRAMIEIAGEPMLSTSINISGLPPENDYEKIKKNFASWFDLAVIPASKYITDNAQPSTIIEYISSNSSGLPELKCIREGSIHFFEIKKAFEMPLVMFVCTANICRSPIAEYLFNHHVKSFGVKYYGDSSGLMESGNMISLNSLQLLLEHGITEAQVHVSQQINPQIINNSWLILTMEVRQRDFLRQNSENSGHKIFTLNEIVGETGDVEDPYGSDLESYRKTYEIIEDRIQKLLKKIKAKEIYQG